MHPLVAGHMLQSCIEPKLFENIPQLIYYIIIAITIYKAFQVDERYAIITQLLGENYLENAGEAIQILLHQAGIQANQEKLKQNTIKNLVTSLGVLPEDIDLKTEREKLKNPAISKNDMKQTLEKILLA